MPKRLVVPLLCALFHLAAARDAKAQGGFIGAEAGGGAPAPSPRVWRATRGFEETVYPPAGAGRPIRVRGARAYDLVLLPDGQEPWTGAVWLAVQALPGVTGSDGGLEMKLADATPYQAYRGYYRAVRHPTDKDIVVFTLGFTRKYRVGDLVGGYRYHRGIQEPAGTDLDWALDPRFEPTGVAAEAPAGGTVDRLGSFLPKLTLTPTRAFFVDDRGQETVRRHAPYTLGEKLLGGPVRTPRAPDYLPLGATLRFAETDASGERLWKSPPPTFRP